MKYALTNCNIVDVRAGECLKGKAVSVDGERISGIIAESGLPETLLRVDLKGKYLCPGLIDCHSHCFIGQFGDSDAVLASEMTARAGRHLEGMLRRGFTTVRDAGGADYGHKAALEQGLFAGPRMFVSGKILSQTAGHGDHRGKASPCSCGTSAEGIAVIADGVDAVRLAVRENLRKGVDQIKIMAGGGVSSPGDELAYPQYSMDELTAISDEAGRFGRYVMSHVYADLGIRRAVEGGVRSIEHGNFLTSDTAKLMRDREACLVPTLVTYVADAKYGKSFGWSDENERKNGEVLAAGLRSLEAALEQGVLIGYGTDLCWSPKTYQGDGLAIHEQVCGPAEALRHATINNAEIVRMGGEIGEIATGAFVDLLVLDADPLKGMECFSQHSSALVGVIQGGRFVRDDLGLAAGLGRGAPAAADAMRPEAVSQPATADRTPGPVTITLLTRAVLCGTHDACRLACDSFARKLFRGLRARSLREARAGARLRASCALARTGATRGASRAFRRRGRSCRGWRRNWG